MANDIPPEYEDLDEALKGKAPPDFMHGANGHHKADPDFPIVQASSFEGRPIPTPGFTGS